MSDNTTEAVQSPEISIEAEMKKSYLDYAMSVIIGGRCPMSVTGSNPFTAASFCHAGTEKRLQQTLQEVGPHRR
jgi:hypothetical protein